MTAASPAGTPLFISELSLVISLLAAVGWIATAFMARLNLQRQIQVASREAWMREFRERVAQFVASIVSAHYVQPSGVADLMGAATSSLYATTLLLAEKGRQDAGFGQIMNRLLVSGRPDNADEASADFSAGITEVLNAAGVILLRERALIEAGGAVGCPSWSRFMAWCRGRPLFPT
jgi:hypothetical protein